MRDGFEETTGPDRAHSAAAAGDRSIAAREISGVTATGDNPRIDARQIVMQRSSTGSPVVQRLSNLPKPPTRLFLGRDEDLARLEEVMAAGRGVVSQAVHGLGGVGKTELALQYANRQRDQFEVRWWVTADSPAAIQDGLAELTALVNPELTLTAGHQDAAGWAVAWLQNRSGWLLVLDNVEDRGDVEPLLGRLDTGEVLITTRRDVGWEAVVDGCLRLGMLDRASAVRLLVEAGGQSDQLTAAVLADELGYLPLALRQAAGFLRQTQMPMSEYLDRLRAQPAEVLNRIAEGDLAERAVAQVWLETLNRLREQRPAAVDLLGMLSCYAPEAVPRDVLAGYPGGGNVVGQALAVLASYNLVTLTVETVETHRLVQAVVRAHAQIPRLANTPEHQQPSSWPRIVDQAVAMLNQARPRTSPSNDVDSWPRWLTLSPHIEAVTGHIPTDSENLEAASLIGQLGFFHNTQGNYNRAIVLEQRALAISEAALPEGHPDVALRLDNLAQTLVDLGRPAEALPLQQRALAISEAALPEGHPSVALRLDNLAYTLGRLGRAAEALPLRQRALAISEAALPEGHPDVALRLDNLAYTLGRLGRAAEALPLRQRAAEMRQTNGSKASE
ncbi:tetratricopeptide repeat protein [Micromonospora sp. NPDC051141]|uniref:tetratricopeptide repeat protein n=1 Tax=Micromonospora sp. NPDC051141 TaxID=3364284 RepID=UPI0037BCEEA5